MCYGINLAAEWGSIGVRRLYALVIGLPPDAPVWREEHDEAESWTRMDEFAAQAIETMDKWFRALYVANGGKLPGKHSVPAPIEYPRPGHVVARQQEAAKKLATKKRVTSLDQMSEIASFFGSTGKTV